MRLTINVVDGESVREVGHVCLLPEWGLLLGLRLCRTPIIQTLDRQTNKRKVSNTVCFTVNISQNTGTPDIQGTTRPDIRVPV